VEVMRIVMHPAFTLKSYNYDLAILTLRNRVQEQNDTQVIPLASQPADVGSQITVTGWGQIGAQEPESKVLLRAELTILEQEDCVARWGTGQSVLGSMFCGMSQQQSSCKGDSGGPVTNSNGQLVGVVSWGSSKCLHELLPNVFVNLTRKDVREWIDVNLIV